MNFMIYALHVHLYAFSKPLYHVFPLVSDFSFRTSSLSNKSIFSTLGNQALEGQNNLNTVLIKKVIPVVHEGRPYNISCMFTVSRAMS